MSHICLSNRTQQFRKNIGKYFINFNIRKHKFQEKVLRTIKQYARSSYEYKTARSIIEKHDREIINFCNDNPFIDSSIVETIVSNRLEHVHIVYKNNNIHIYTPVDKDGQCLNIDRMLHIIDFMRGLSRSTNSLVLNIFCTDKEKSIDPVGSSLNTRESIVLGPKHVNSGSCYRGEMITIWRNEEINKVLIHELIHFLELDFISCIGKEYFFKRFGLAPVKVFESFTDSLAIIIHTLYVSYYTNIDYLELMNIELNFVVFQAAKITNHYGATCSSCFGPNCSVQTRTRVSPHTETEHAGYSCVNDLKGRIKQDTDVLSYYVLKASIMFDMTNLLNFFYDDIYFSKRDMKFIKMIDNGLNSVLFNKTIGYYKKVHLRITDLYVKNSLRMVMLELSN